MVENTSKPNKLYSFLMSILPSSKKNVMKLSDEIVGNRQALEEQIERLDKSLEENYRLRLEDRAAFEELGKRYNEINDEISLLKEKSNEIHSTLKLYQDNTDNLFSDLKTDFKSEFESSIKRLESLQAAINDMAGMQKTISDTTNMIRIQIPFDRVIYQNFKPEKDRFIDGFVKGMQDFENIAEKYMSLIKDMDSESVETVERIINRARRISKLDSGDVDIYTYEEQQELRQMFDHFDKNIVELNSDLYCYKNYFMPINYFNPSVLYYYHGMNELKTLKYIRQNNIIDAGAFIGDSALVLSKYTDKKVHSFEAMENNYELFKKTIEYNKLENIVLENKALGDYTGQITFYESEIMDECSYIQVDGTEKEVIVDCTTIDEYVEKNSLKVGLIKTDVEGAEKNLIKGAMKTITEQRPTLLISIYHSAEDFFDIKPMLESLNLNYQFRIYRPAMMNVLTDTILIAECRDHFE